MNTIYNNSNDTIKEIIINLGSCLFMKLEWDRLNDDEIIKRYNSNNDHEYINQIKNDYEEKLNNIIQNNEMINNGLKGRINELELNKEKNINEALVNVDKINNLEKQNLINELGMFKEKDRLTSLIEEKICDKKEFNNPTEQGDYVEKLFDEIINDGLTYDTKAVISDTSDYGGSGDRIIKFSNGVVIMIEVKNKDVIKKSDIDEFKKCYEKDFRENKIDCALFFSYRTPQIPNVCKAIIPYYLDDSKIVYYGLNDNLTKPQKRLEMESIIEKLYYIHNEKKTEKINKDVSNIHIYNNYLNELNENKIYYNKKLKENQKEAKLYEGKLSENDKQLNNLYRDIQENNITVDQSLLDDKLYRKNLIIRVKEWKESSQNGRKKEWRKYCSEELKLSENDTNKIKNIKVTELN